MKSTLIILFSLAILLCNAQPPKAKVDINMEGRNANEVNQENYTPWFIARVASSKITVADVTFELRTVSPSINTTFRASWSKALVQSPHFSRLVNDGVKIDNDTLIKNPGIAAAFELRISGLPKGMHQLQTFHNIWEDTIKVTHAPMNVYLNDQLVFERVIRTIKAIKHTDATILLFELDVKENHQEIVLRFAADPDFVPTQGKTADLNVCINAFELNTDDASKQAREPLPGNADLHVDADNGYVDLEWKPASNNFTLRHLLYFGTDSAGVASAGPENTSIYKGELSLDKTSFRVEGLTNLKTYYWRVDQTDSIGTSTKGKIWYFRPRKLAFRGAEGYGRFATGGRGGTVVYVSNLNDSGPGSFRDAVTGNKGPRTVLFNVSGIISLKSRLVIDPFVTVAGQTAPGKGVCFRSAPVGVGKESIVRFIRVRLGAGTTYDGLGSAGGNHTIIDHCSVSWTIDEAFSSRGAYNITLQRTLISEALNIAGHSNYPEGRAHGFAASIGGDVGSFHHNLLAHCQGRNWSLAGGLDGRGYYAGRLDIFNNVVYNWGSRATDGGAHEVNFVNNYYKKGTATTQNTILIAQLEGLGKGSQSYFYSGNMVENTNGGFACDGTNNTCSRTYDKYANQILDWEVFVNEPFFPSFATIHSAKDAYKSVLSDVGCTMPLFDDHDKRIVRETLTGTYTYAGSKTNKGGIIDHQNDAGGYEDYPFITRPADFDSDLDGLPDWWEKLHGSNLHSAPGDFSDSNADRNNNGYTALDEYMEWMSVPRYFLTSHLSDTIELSGFTKGYNNPVYSSSPLTGFNVKHEGSSVIITPTTAQKGISYLDITASDNEGSTFDLRIGLAVGADKPTGNEALQQKSGISVFPTTFDTHLNLALTMKDDGNLSIYLTDLMGRVVFKQHKQMFAGYNSFKLDLPETLHRQIYLLHIVDASNQRNCSTLRVIKK